MPYNTLNKALKIGAYDCVVVQLKVPFPEGAGAGVSCAAADITRETKINMWSTFMFSLFP
jgi:pantoate kinase